MKKIKISKEFRIGFFGIAMIALLYWGINYVKGSDIFSRSHKYYAVYDQVNGLQTSSAILIKGFKVGNISGMSYDPQRSDKVVVEFTIDSKYHIPDNSKARVFSDGFLGGKAVEIELGTSSRYLNAGDTLFSEINKDFLEVAGNEFEHLKQQANVVIEELTKTLGSLNSILSDNKANLDATLTNVANITGNLSNIVNDEQQALRGIITNLNSLSLSLNQKSGQIDNIVNNAEAFTDSLRNAQFPTLVAELTGTISTLNSAIEKANTGDGSIGLLLNDKELYTNLVAAGHNLSWLLEDLRQNPKRYINLTVFGGRNRD